MGRVWVRNVAVQSPCRTLPAREIRAAGPVRLRGTTFAAPLALFHGPRPTMGGGWRATHSPQMGHTAMSCRPH